MGGGCRSVSNLGPIGVFDSGIGGLSVLREIRRALPGEELVYVADSAHVPYGNKSSDYIRQRSFAITRFLAGQGAKAVVVACNTATAAAVQALRQEFGMPIVGMEPAVKPAAAATRSGVVGVLATVGTLESGRFAALLARFGAGVRVITQPCPGLVEQVERGDLVGSETRRLVEQFTLPLLRQGADTIILGCTHYPFLRSLISELAGPDVVVIDTGAAVASQLRRVLETNHLSSRKAAATERFWTSGSAEAMQRALFTLWSGEARADVLPDL